MGLQIRIAGERCGLAELVPEGFTQDNLDPQFPPCDALDPETVPKGVLGGSVAGLYGNLLVGRGDATHRAVGLFERDARGDNLVGNSAAGSGKLTYMKGHGSYEIDIYETRTWTDSEDLIYLPGDSLFISMRGFLTRESGPEWCEEVIAVVIKAPTAADPVMWIDLRI